MDLSQGRVKQVLERARRARGRAEARRLPPFPYSPPSSGKSDEKPMKTMAECCKWPVRVDNIGVRPIRLGVVSPGAGDTYALIDRRQPDGRWTLVMALNLRQTVEFAEALLAAAEEIKARRM